MKTILHTIDTTGPGGAETVFVNLASKIDRERFRSVVAINGPGWVQDELRRRGLSPYVLNAGKNTSFDVSYLRQLMSIVCRERIDLIHSHLFGSNVYSSIAGLLCGVPAVSTFHGAVDVDSRDRLRSLKFALINAGSCKAVFVSDHLRRNILSGARLALERTARIYNGIDLARQAPGRETAIRRELGLRDEDVLVGAVGNLRPAKGYHILLQAAALLAAQDERFKIVIAGHGSGKLHEQLLALRARLGLQHRVFFLGFRADVVEFLRNLDIFVLSSITEGLSISTIEALACGLPVVVTRSGGPEEIVRHEDNGLLVDVDSPGQIAAAIERITTDAALRRTLCTNAPRSAMRFGEADMIAAYESLYEEITHKQPRRSARLRASDTTLAPPKG
jgi:glycosyltransferase involved in cell wall biosynthesis